MHMSAQVYTMRTNTYLLYTYAYAWLYNTHVLAHFCIHVYTHLYTKTDVRKVLSL